MKRVLGSIWVLWMAAVSLFGAEPYRWYADTAKSAVFTHEAVEVRFTCRFDDSGALYVIDFQPPLETERYRLVLLGEEEEIVSGKRVNTYRYLFFAKRPGTLELSFEALMRKTSRESIENTVIGRDNVEDFEFTDRRVLLPGLHYEVKETQTPVVGAFQMRMEHSEPRVEAFEPLHVRVVVEGIGNFEGIVPFNIDLPGVEVFAEAPEHDYRAAADGYKGAYVQQFALVAERPYTLPAFALEYFSPGSGRLERLSTEPLRVEVAEGYRAEALLDDETPEAAGWRWAWSDLYYLLAFLAGVGIGRWGRIRVTEEQTDNGWKKRLERVEDLEGLMVLLVLSGDPRYRPLIAALESEGEAYGLGRAKKEAMRLTGE